MLLLYSWSNLSYSFVFSKVLTNSQNNIMLCFTVHNSWNTTIGNGFCFVLIIMDKTIQHVITKSKLCTITHYISKYVSVEDRFLRFNK